MEEDGEQTDLSRKLPQHRGSWQDIPGECIWKMVRTRVEKYLVQMQTTLGELGPDADEAPITEGMVRAAFTDVVDAAQPLVSEEQWQYITDALAAASQALSNGLLNSSPASPAEGDVEAVASAFKLAGISKREMAQQRARRSGSDARQA